MTDQPAQIPLRLSVDEQALTRSQTGVALLSQKLADLRKTATDTGVSVDKAASSLGDGIAKATPLMDRLSAAAEKAAQSAKAASGNWNDLRDSIFQASGAADKASGSFNVEGLRRTGGALSQLGLGAIGGPVSRVGDIAQVGKEFGNLTKSLTDASGATQPLIAGLSAGTVALGALAVAGGVLVGGLALIRAEYEKNNAVIQEAISRLDTYYGAIATGDKKAIQSKLDQLKAEQDAAQKELDVIKTAREKGFDAAVQQYGDLGARILTALGSTGLYGDTLKDTSAKQDELTKKIADTKGQIAGLTDALGSSEIAAKDATAAILAQADTVKAQYLKDYENSQLSADAAKKKAEQIKATIEADSAEIEALKASGDQSKETQDKIAALTKEAFDLDSELQKLNNVFIPAAQHAQELADKTKAADQAMQDRAKAMDEAAKVEEKNQADIATSYGKYKNDITNIEQSSAEKQAEIHKQLADKLVDESRKMVEQAQDALQKLSDKRAELLTNLNRGEEDAQRKAAYDDLTLQIKDQEAAQKSYQDHLNKLEDIRRSAWADEQQALLDRNFVALAKSRLNVATQMQNENVGFGRSEKDRIQQEQSARQDAQRQRAFEHEQRLIAYQQANQDAVRQYQIQLRDQAIADARMRQQAQIDAQRAIEQDRQKTQAAIQIRTQQELAELKVMQQGGAARVKIEAQIQQQLVSQAMQFLNSAGRSAAFSGIQSGGIYAPATSRTSVQLQQTNNFPANLTNNTALSQLVASHTLSALKQVLV